MKLHFESDLDYQLQAIEAVCDLFQGQELCRNEFTVTSENLPLRQLTLWGTESDLGIGNRLTLLDEEILKNLQTVQLRNGLPVDERLSSRDFTVEMETGTGKTYVYLRTIFELNKRYGFTKFVIVVPSIAIKEGVYKTLQITEEHFRSLYAGVPFDYYLYDSTQLGRVRNFALSPHIQIMVVTVGAINKKDVNNLYKDSEKTGGEKPIDLIKATHPIVIVDEPQSVDGGLEGRGKEALAAMNPLCTLRYSATHVNKHHMVYRLDAVDAYERKLVKQIEVASATVQDAHNKPYVRLVSLVSKRGQIYAEVELDVQTRKTVQRKVVTVFDGDSLDEIAGRAIYASMRIGEINLKQQYMELRFPGGEVFLQPGQSYGDVDRLVIHREMIRRTIKEHLDKELRLTPLGIKVLSLFFIDEVAKYRSYDADGNPVKGPYAQIFEEEYLRAAKLPAYKSLFKGVDPEDVAQKVHNGYFSIDKRGCWTDTAEDNQTARENAERAYNLIMKDKEKLLSFETPLKFIFSHSALKEGWDNPNVFQICVLRDIGTERERRQTIGRGLRLCVNQKGERIRNFEVNTLTVIANESYEEFAENLQREIEEDTGFRFGLLKEHQFAGIKMVEAQDQTLALGVQKSKELWEHLRSTGYIDVNGKAQDLLREALNNGTLKLPTNFEKQRQQIVEVLRKVCGRMDIKNADERRTISLRRENDGKAVYLSDDFKALWDRIKDRTTYRLHFNNEKLIEDCLNGLRNAPEINRTRLLWRRANIAIGQSGVDVTQAGGDAVVSISENDIDLPDLLTELQNRTQLTRRSLVDILIKSNRLNDFRRNPQRFIEIAAEVINCSKQQALVGGIKYQRLDNGYYALELFEQEELTGYLKNILRNARKSIYEHIVYDSEVERRFAEEMEQNEAVKLYVKLPAWFEVPTPLGPYKPDWAVIVEDNETHRLYFVVETKGSMFADDLRGKEKAKIECGEKHFQALAIQQENPIRYKLATSLNDVLADLID